jgi:hypothetical protein
MAEFLFKNLSVKLLASDEQPVDECGECTNCTGCSGTTDCTQCTFCTDNMSCMVCTCAGGTDVLIASKPDLTGTVIGFRDQLALYKDRLRKAIAEIEEQERNYTAYDEPSSIEEIDELKDRLSGAIAELDQRRAQMDADRAAGPE